MKTQENKMKHILVLDDDLEMQKLYQMFFSEYENVYTIDFETKALSGLKKIKNEHYDLIILDIIMEPMAGDMFFVYLRQNTNSMHTPVLVVSVLNPDLLKNLKKINHIDFLQKPITQDQLLGKAALLLG